MHKSRVVLVCMALILALALLIPLVGCKSGGTTATPTPTPTAIPTPTTTPALFGFQGTGIGNWSGQLVISNKTIAVSGTMSVAIDANGVLSGSITSSTGNAADTTVTAQVDSNGNLNGTVSFTVGTRTFVTTWQGKVTASGNNLRIQGTWTSEYGSGIFSGTGTK